MDGYEQDALLTGAMQRTSADAELAAAALAARACGRNADAAELWRQLLRRCPEDWRAALDLKRDLTAGLHYSEADPLFRRAARHLPDAHWLAHYRLLFAFHNGDLDVLDSRAREVAARRPDDPAVHVLLGDISRQRRDWATAGRAFEAALALDPGCAEVADKLRTVRLRQRVGRALAAKPATGEGYAVALVNLDRNRERLAEAQRQFRDLPVPLRRVPAVEGSRLPYAAVRRLIGNDADVVGSRGTLGCFLSHAAAWEAMLARGLGHCLVIEDDVVLLVDLPARLGPLGLPPGYDVCFANDRLEPRPGPAEVERTDEVGAVPLAEAMLSFHPEDNAPGCDGYFVSAAGARKLLDWVAEDGFGGDVDWRLLAYGLTAAEVAALPAGHARSVLEPMERRVGRAERLRAHVLYPALIRTVPISSDREDENRA